MMQFWEADRDAWDHHCNAKPGNRHFNVGFKSVAAAEASVRTGPARSRWRRHQCLPRYQKVGRHNNGRLSCRRCNRPAPPSPGRPRGFVQQGGPAGEAQSRQEGYSRLLLPTWGNGKVELLLGAIVFNS
jgi:hypothetical protein